MATAAMKLNSHENWLLIKRYIVKLFEESKDIAYITFFDLLDNLIPAALDDIDTWVNSEIQFKSDISDIKPVKEHVKIDERLKKRIA
ncbi:20365_t:CDS:2, partial [Racocetra persica]